MYEVGGEKFETKKALEERAWEIRDKYEPGEQVTSDADEEWVMALLDLGMEHIDGWGWDTEWAEGICGIKVDYNAHGTVSFYVIREGRDDADFGVKTLCPRYRLSSTIP